MKELCRGCRQYHELNARRVCAKCQIEIDLNMHPERSRKIKGYGGTQRAYKKNQRRIMQEKYLRGALPKWMYS